MPPSPHAYPLPGSTTVLLVDDEPAILSAMSDGLSAQDSSLVILTATSAEEALEVLGRARVGVVVTDLCMPGKDGFWLLIELQNRLPDIPRIVCSSALTPAACYRIERAGVLECLHKPVSPRELYQKIVQLAGQAQRLSFIRGISLTSILQLLELEQKTCAMTIQHRFESGQIFVVHGSVHDAKSGALRGVEAVFKMLSWKETQIAIDDHYDVAIPDVIGLSVTALVMEAAQRIDEQGNGADMSSSYEVHTGLMDSDPVNLMAEPETPMESDFVPETVELDPAAYPDLSPEDLQEMARLIARVRLLKATDIFEFGYDALKRGRLELAREMLRVALQREPDNRLIQHNLRVIEKKIAASASNPVAGGIR